MIDLMISAEAAFLEGRTELGYRLALSCAAWWSGPDATRRQVFNFMHNAYDARSRLVHGDKPRLRGLDGNVVSEDEFLSSLDLIMRTSLRKAVGTLVRGQTLDFRKAVLDAVAPEAPIHMEPGALGSANE